MFLPNLPLPEVKKETFKCLVANDCEFQLMQIGLILKNSKIEVTEAINGLEALEHVTVSKKRFDFILLDLGMPIMDGFDAC
jgi:CheY-like chemotaxis protein